MIIYMTQTNFTRASVGGTWTECSRERREIDEQFYERTVAPETVEFFRNLGGSERVSKGNTFYGRKIVKISSVSPDGLDSVIREFEFK